MILRKAARALPGSRSGHRFSIAGYNMAITIKLILRNSKKRSDGTAPIYLRITTNRRSRFKTTCILVAPKYWNSKRQKLRKSHELSTALNDRLRMIRLEAERAALAANTAAGVKMNWRAAGAR